MGCGCDACLKAEGTVDGGMSVPASGAGTTPAGKPLPVALEFAVDRMLKRQMLTAWEKWQQTCVRRSEVCQ